jgi:hypothetical protein
MIMRSFPFAAGSLLAIAAQAFAADLPTVDLGYALYKASSFNVSGALDRSLSYNIGLIVDISLPVHWQLL